MLFRSRRRGDHAALDGGIDRERDLRALYVRWTPWLEISHALPLAAVLLLGGWAYAEGLASLGTVTTMVVYTQAVATPLDTALWWVEDLMVAATALRRVLGVQVPPRPAVAPVGPRTDAGLEVEGVRFAYRSGRPNSFLPHRRGRS